MNFPKIAKKSIFLVLCVFGYTMLIKTNQENDFEFKTAKIQIRKSTPNSGAIISSDSLSQSHFAQTFEIENPRKSKENFKTSTRKLIQKKVLNVQPNESEINLKSSRKLVSKKVFWKEFQLKSWYPRQSSIKNQLKTKSVA